MEHHAPRFVVVVVDIVVDDDAMVDHKYPPVRSCDSLGILKLVVGDGAQESAIEVEQSQPGALRMALAGQNDHLIAMHSDAADGHVLPMLLGFNGLNSGDDLQVGIKEDHRIAPRFSDDTIGPLSLLVHCNLH